MCQPVQTVTLVWSPISLPIELVILKMYFGPRDAQGRRRQLGPAESVPHLEGLLETIVPVPGLSLLSPVVSQLSHEDSGTICTLPFCLKNCLPSPRFAQKGTWSHGTSDAPETKELFLMLFSYASSVVAHRDLVVIYIT